MTLKNVNYLSGTFLSILLLICTGYIESIQAQQTYTELGVQDAVEYAYQNNPELNRLLEAVNQLNYNRRNFSGIGNPEISYLKEGIDNNAFQEQRWSINQTLDFPTTLVHQNRVTSFQQKAAEAAYFEAKLRLKAEVKSAYTRLAYAIEILNLRQKQVDLTAEIKDITLERKSFGEMSRLDELQANLQYSGAQNRLENATRDFHEKRYALFKTIGLEENQDYGIQFPDTLEYNEISVDHQEVLDAILTLPVVNQLNFSINAAESNLKAARSDYLPDLRGSYFWQDYGNGYNFHGFEVGISIPIWFSLKQQPKINALKSELKQVELSTQSELLKLKFEAENSWHSFDLVQNQIENYNESIRKESVELLELTREAYRVGEVPLITLLEAQRTYLNSIENYLEALKDYNLSVINLEMLLQKDLIYVQD